MMKRIIAVVAIVLSSGLLASPLVASANCGPDFSQDVHVGDLVKINSRSTIFYIADNGLRYNFPNAGVYQSWFGNDFSKVKTISATRFNSIPIGGYVMYRPGSLVKFNTSRDVYVVTKNNELRRLANPTVARAIFGANWNRKIATLPANFAGSVKIRFDDIASVSDYQITKQVKPIEVTFAVPLNMVVFR